MRSPALYPVLAIPADALALRTQMTSIFKNQIIPLPKPDAVDEQALVDRLMLVATYLEEPAYKALERLTGLKGYSR